MKNIIPKPILIGSLAFILVVQGISLSYAANDYPIVFSTQVPIPADFATIGSTFGNHDPGIQSAARGGDLWIRYTDGSLKNLTEAAGYGNEGFQGTGSIAVRDPAVNWEGDKVIFSMAVDASTNQYEFGTYYWQLYEITKLGKNETPVISKVANQPGNYNNISPIYGKDDRIIFSSDIPQKGTNTPHLYPQLDEYESSPTTTGLWSLNPQTSDLFMVTHAPSGDFTPIIDSFGRVIFSRWDHLKRDQQADAYNTGEITSSRALNWSNENASTTPSNDKNSGVEIFPEPRFYRPDLLEGTNLVGHDLNQFFPWMVNEDGSELETLNHIGRHELHQYFDRVFNDDDNLIEFNGVQSYNQNKILNFLHIQEDPLRPGVYIGIDVPEFDSHSAGRIVELGELKPGMNPDLAKIKYLTHPDTNIITDANNPPRPEHTGHYRDPLPLSNGTIIAAHTAWTGGAGNVGSRANPRDNSDFRLKFLTQSNGYLAAGTPLTTGITKTISYWDPDVKVTYTGNLWELHPVELRPRNRPNPSVTVLEAPETSAFTEAGVDPDQFKSWLKEQNLALVVSRNVTTRDGGDQQQPFNLKIAGSNTQTIGATGKVYDISHLQFFQGDLVRGYADSEAPAGTSNPGRRVLAQPMHDDAGQNLTTTGPTGSVKLGADGSMAAFVPARRALSWQMTDNARKDEKTKGVVVRERVWLSFSPGEVRVCTSCHGINTTDQSDAAEPVNKPQALVDLLIHWSNNNTAPDHDNDGIPDTEDNCTLIANTNQRDTDGDGFGNRCDADLNNDLIINAADFILLRNRLNSNNLDADINGDETVNAADFILLRNQLNNLPGPSCCGETPQE